MLRREGWTLSQISEDTGVERDSVANRIKLGERLLSLEPPQEENRNG